MVARSPTSFVAYSKNPRNVRGYVTENAAVASDFSRAGRNTLGDFPRAIRSLRLNKQTPTIPLSLVQTPPPQIPSQHEFQSGRDHLPDRFQGATQSASGRASVRSRLQPSTAAKIVDISVRCPGSCAGVTIPSTISGGSMETNATGGFHAAPVAATTGAPIRRPTNCCGRPSRTLACR